jgi:aspartate racemase
VDPFSSAIQSQFSPIGVLGGSGPDAALNICASIVDQARKVLPETLRGDQTAPLILLRSDPRLGASMNLSYNRPYVLNALIEGLDALSTNCEHIAIACNTLNLFGMDTTIRGKYPKVLWFQDVLSEQMALFPGKQFDIYGVRSVVSAPYQYSPYRDIFLRAPDRVRGVDVSDMITEIKQGYVQCAQERFRELLALSADRIAVLACTELALMNVNGDRKADNVIDMNVCVAEAIVQAARKRFSALSPSIP